PTTLALDGVDEHVGRSFSAALSRLSEAGARIDEIEVPEFAQLAAINAKGGFTAAEAWAWHRDLIARAADRYDPRVVSRIRRGQDMSAADYLDLLDARERSEEHTSELQSRENLVCRLLLEKQKRKC